MGKDPLCMMQYYNVFGTCRVPGLRRDEIKHYGGTPPLGPRHICVLHNNRVRCNFRCSVTRSCQLV